MILYFKNIFKILGFASFEGFISFKNSKFYIFPLRFPNSVVSLSFSPEGTLLAIASTYMYEEERDDPASILESALAIRRMTDIEVRPK